MEDFHAAGGMGALLRELRPLLHLDTVDVEGRTLAERLDEPLDWVDRTVIRAVRRPGLAGGRAGGADAAAWRPDGAIFKRAAATPALFESEGRAVVFTGPGGPAPRGSTTPTSTCSRTTSWCCRTPARTRRGCPRPATCRSRRSWRRPGSRTWCASPTRACPGRPSARSCCTSRRRRRSAGRWRPCATATASASRSRTSASTCWSSEAEIARRLAGFRPPPAPARGYKALYRRTVTQAPEGCDFDFLAATGRT